MKNIFENLFGIGLKRTKKIITDPENYSHQGIMAGTIYAGKNIPIRKQKIVTKTDRFGNIKKQKIVDYGPINYYGKQKKTKKVIKY